MANSADIQKSSRIRRGSRTVLPPRRRGTYAASAISTAARRSGRRRRTGKGVEGRPRKDHRRTPSRGAETGGIRSGQPTDGADHRRLEQRHPAARLVAVPDALQPASAAGKDDAVLAQPLRHQQRQGAERPLHARPVRADAPARPGQFLRSAKRRCPATRPC